MTETISQILQERGTRYGEFIDHARITCALKNVVHAEAIRRAEQGKTRITADQMEALDMICHKIGRILNGDPDYADSWIDIAGYAKLVADRLEKPEAQFAGAPQQLADAPVDRLRGPLSSGLPRDIDARSGERSGKCVDPRRRT